MARPRLLLMDEPSMGLRRSWSTRSSWVVRAIHRQGTTILLVEQNGRALLRGAM
jgi:branched-chain amino acid transport system ATP-binding protein